MPFRVISGDSWFMDVTGYRPEDQLNLKVIVSLNRCLQSLQREEVPVIQAAGLTMAQFGVLEHLYHKGDRKICQIMEKTLATGGNMTVIVDNLEKQKLVERREDPDDRRARIIRLTAVGRALIAELFPRHLENLERILAVLSEAEKRKLVALARKLGLSLHRGPEDGSASEAIGEAP